MPTQTLRPIEAISSTNFTVVGALSAPDALDEVTPDDDTSYMRCSANGGGRVLVRLQPHGVPNEGIVNAVTILNRARREAGSVGDYLAIPIVQVDTTIYDLTAGDVLATGYQDISVTITTNPKTGQPWTAAEARRLIAGLRVAVFDLPAPKVRLTQVYGGLDHIAPVFVVPGRFGRAA